MAQYFTIARPYARAIFEIAIANNQLDAWAQCLEAAALVARDEKVQHFLSGPVLTNAQWVQLFMDVVKPAEEAPARNFFALLAEHKRLKILPDIAELYDNMVAKQRGLVNVEVFSAEVLSDEQREKMKSALEKRFATEVTVEFAVDEALIGGALVRSGNWVLDDSIRGKLARLEESLS